MKSWVEKLKQEKKYQVKQIDKAFADIPAGGKMLIATPKIVDEYVRQIPKGKTTDLNTMRKDLAIMYNADYTCPVTTGMYLRIVAEAACEQMEQGKDVSIVTPFWRVIDEESKLADKIYYGPSFIKQQRKREGLPAPSNKPSTSSLTAKQRVKKKVKGKK